MDVTIASMKLSNGCSSSPKPANSSNCGIKTGERSPLLVDIQCGVGAEHLDVRTTFSQIPVELEDIKDNVLMYGHNKLAVYAWKRSPLLSVPLSLDPEQPSCFLPSREFGIGSLASLLHSSVSCKPYG